jgi:hypothetical protein
MPCRFAIFNYLWSVRGCRFVFEFVAVVKSSELGFLDVRPALSPKS